MKRAIKSVLYMLLGIIVVCVGFVGLFSGDAVYYLPCFQKSKPSTIKNKTVIFLGSSVTKGYGSFNQSFVDYLERQYGIIAVKETVNGTTLIDNGEKSYIQRIKSIDPDIEADMFICQLSTNDATKNSPLGSVGDSFDIDSFDTGTVAGAIEYIICYAKQTWNCPVAFYTQMKYNSENYQKMYDVLMQIQQKWDIPVLDLWNSSVRDKMTTDSMVDSIHPTMVCYRDTLTPMFYSFIEENVTEG